MSNVVPDAWWFVTAAYVVGIGGTVGLVASSLVALRRAERRAETLGR